MCFKPIQRRPPRLAMGSGNDFDSVTVTLISNEGSSLGLLSPSDSGAAVNRPVRGIAALAVQMAEKTPGTRAALALRSTADIAWMEMTDFYMKKSSAL